MKDEQSQVGLVAQLYFDYACRALLGGGKGEYVMMKLYEESPETYRVVLEAARVSLAKTPNRDLGELDRRYRQLQVIVGDFEKERSD